MSARTVPQNPGAAAGDLESLVGAVDQHLDALGIALSTRDAAAIERHAQALHRCLAQTADGVAHAERQGAGVPRSLRQRLALANAKAAAHRDTLLRASSALERALDVLLPRPAAPVYAAPFARFNPAAPGSLR